MEIIWAGRQTGPQWPMTFYTYYKYGSFHCGYASRTVTNPLFNVNCKENNGEHVGFLW